MLWNVQDAIIFFFYFMKQTDGRHSASNFLESQLNGTDDGKMFSRSYIHVQLTQGPGKRSTGVHPWLIPFLRLYGRIATRDQVDVPLPWKQSKREKKRKTNTTGGTSGTWTNKTKHNEYTTVISSINSIRPKSHTKTWPKDTYRKS